ncbi:CAP domain-containing protein [Streptomyces sp. NPDC015127]|uniref:CAP domain-containing protein n=1 Tax=Streptomyces sp. NPDC015127 TaxID=3364939 RepID=UPI0036FE16F1
MNNSVLVSAVAALLTLTATATAALTPPPPWVHEPGRPPAWEPSPVPSWRPPSHRPVSPPARQNGQPHGSTSAGSGNNPGTQDGYRSFLVRLVNEERAAAGCPRVSTHPALNRTAQAHSTYMARAQRLSHTGEGGSAPGSRLTAAGYDFSRAGENIVAGPEDPAGAVRAWMNSSKHRSSILTCQFRHAGVGRGAGRNGPWWTLLLAAPR